VTDNKSSGAGSKTASADSHTDSETGSKPELIGKLADRKPTVGDDETATGDPTRGPGVEGDTLSADRPDVPEGDRADEPPMRVEAPKYPGPRVDDASHEQLLHDSPQRHAAMITGEYQAGHRYPHGREA
jgi:hypothetical protein